MELKLKYQTPYLIRLRDGTECEAMLIHHNPQFHSKHPIPDEWRKTDRTLPKKQRRIESSDIVAIMAFKAETS